MNKLIFTTAFDRDLKKLARANKSLRKQIKKTIRWMHKDMNHPSLRLHKLTGENNWSVSVNREVRIIFRWEDGVVYCLRIGSHDEVY